MSASESAQLAQTSSPPAVGACTPQRPLVEGGQRISLRRITARTVADICDLSETLTTEQRAMVADAHFSESAWFRAIYVGEDPAGFIMLHNGYDYEDGLECHGVFLWRLMVAGPYQGLGVGRRAIEMIVESLKARGISELYAGCGQGPSSPGPFYEKLGFVPSGVFYGDDDDEIGIVLRW
ncbi:GNAT family N-acetyltransferase [Nocardia gipuzkoensis]|uniref:GNAT family N-acetyltransferase n=1 Tax=Nocardia gipuzkoensis TaxID=2749991 RepID=UPI0024552B87|nr:GNAT family N-acetyltransferase [Nocardia gipuzkoensis]